MAVIRSLVSTSVGAVAYVRNTEYGGDRNSESSLYTVNCMRPARTV